MKLSDYFSLQATNYKEWQNKIVNRDSYFQILLKENSEAHFKEAEPLLIKWFNYFSEALPKPKKNPKLQCQLLKQWNHAAKLFLCAWFVAKENNNFPESLETEDDIETLELNFREFKQQSEIAKLCNITDEIAKLCNITIDKDELVLLCSIFHSKIISAEVREIPFATAGNDTGQIHLLEIRRVMGGGKALRNPTQFPYVDNYANEINDDFGKAVQQALTSNLNTKKWDEEKSKLKTKVDELKASDKRTYAEEVELRESEKELKFREDLGVISKWGIIWDVKPFLSPSKLEEIAIYEKKIEKAQKENLNADGIEKPEILKPLYELKGESVGLAALIGIYLTLRNKYPDNRLVYSAQLEIGNDQITDKIKRVDGIPDKIRAAINTDFIDTFVIHQDNFKKELERLKQGKIFEIKAIDSKGDFADTCPK